MSDLLAEFRRKGTGAPAAPKQRTSENYTAFDGKDRMERLRILRANGAARSPNYADLLEIIYDGPFGTEIVRLFTFMGGNDQRPPSRKTRTRPRNPQAGFYPGIRPRTMGKTQRREPAVHRDFRNHHQGKQ